MSPTKWWENLSSVKIKYDPSLEEGIPFGFASNHEMIQVVNYCVIYAKYFIYIQRLYIGDGAHHMYRPMLKIVC